MSEDSDFADSLPFNKPKPISQQQSLTSNKQIPTLDTEMSAMGQWVSMDIWVSQQVNPVLLPLQGKVDPWR